VGTGRQQAWQARLWRQRRREAAADRLEPSNNDAIERDDRPSSIDRKERDDSERGRQGSGESGGARVRRRKLSTKPSSESRDHPASTSGTGGQEVVRARRWRERRREAAPTGALKPYNISQRGLDDRKHGRQGSSESGGAKQRRRELSNNNAIERIEIPPSIYQ
jgi:hypothetical protein